MNRDPNRRQVVNTLSERLARRTPASMNIKPWITNSAAKPKAPLLMAEKCMPWYATPVQSHIAASPAATTRLRCAEGRMMTTTIGSPSMYAST